MKSSAGKGENKMINYEKKFDEYWISERMRNYGTDRKTAKFHLDYLKKNKPTMYKIMLDNYFDEVHPY